MIELTRDLLAGGDPITLGSLQVKTPSQPASTSAYRVPSTPDCCLRVGGGEIVSHEHLVGYVKYFVLPFPPNFKETMETIVAALSVLEGDMLQRVRDESEYRIDLCRVTREAHVAHL